MDKIKSYFKNRSGLFIGLGVFTLLIRLIFGQMPSVVEAAYSNGFFLAIRYLLDYTIGLFPFPFSYLLFPTIVFLLIRRWWKRRKNEKGAWKQRLKLAGKNLLAAIGLVYFLFNFMWGFNYNRIPIDQHLGMQLDSLSLEALCLEADWVARRAEAARINILGSDDDSLRYVPNQNLLEVEVRSNIEETMHLMGYPSAGRIRGRLITPGGWMLRIGIAGVYNPFTGEGNVSSAQIPEKWAFTMAHEMSHACGFGDEGTCNFVGMIACEQSDDPYVQYSGRMAYWRHLAQEIVAIDPLLYKMLRHSFSLGVKADLTASYNNSRKYAGKIAKIGRGVNNAYLRAQGVKEGIKSYDRVVLMRAAWHKKTGQ